MTIPPKVLGQVMSCDECQNYVYYSGGMHHCKLVGEAARDKTVVAPFCPLPDYPSNIIAQMEMTILILREPFKYGFDRLLLTHIANKLGLNLNTNSLGLTIPFKDRLEDRDRKVYLGFNYICDLEFRPCEITFMHEEKTFKLYPDDDSPLLLEAADNEGKQWRHHKLIA